MKRLSVLFPALFIAGAAVAQDVPPEVHKDLWCGTAFQLFFDLPETATDEERATAKPYLDGAVMLIDRGSAALKTANFTDEAVAQVKADLIPVVTEQISAGTEAEFTPDECSDLLPPAQ